PELTSVQATLETAMPVLKERAKNLHEIADMAGFLISKRPIDITGKAAKSLTSDTRALLAALRPRLDALKNWKKAAIESEIRAFLNDRDLKLGDIAPALRAALTGKPISPGIFDIVAFLDKAEVLGRLEDQI
ncbi:MAG: glutamate--tRNA ligase, partial [Pseudomonadota bacterium]|nr:glutamate--tRNA ligase [Pseudomonadota bacterium]